MCGLTGFLWAANSAAGRDAPQDVQAMMQAIDHRGPDSQGHWVDGDAGVALGHLRLAIVDLSPAGHQPMAAQSGRYMMVFNGEIYNHQKLRAALTEAGHDIAWKGTSDSETLIEGFQAWGIEETIQQCQGMFAIAVWDRENRTLTMARDRLGEKPLYFGWQGQGEERAFLFGSELKALRAHPSFEGGVSKSAAIAMLRHGHVPEDMSIYDGILKLRPGEMAELSFHNEQIKRWRYWDGAAMYAETTRPPYDPAEATDALDALLQDAVGQQMISDVPIGAFLSGGIDSSVIVGLMQHQSDIPVRSFSIGFHEARYNEAGFAAEVAKHLGTDHTELYVGDNDLRDVIPKLPQIYDEPFADSSQLPTYLVAELARKHVTVALSGDGGDELFCGYDRYNQGARLLAKTKSVPHLMRRGAAACARSVPATVWNKVLEPIRPTPQGKEPNGQRLHRLADYLRNEGTDDLHRKLVSLWRNPQAAIPGAEIPDSILADHTPIRGELTDIERMMQLDMVAYMPDDILTKVDRATMAVALESRAPLLDHRVAEFAFGLPMNLKLRDGKSKWLLRQVLYRYVPAALIERPKMGFEVPIGLWLRSGLRDWAGDLLSPDRLTREGFFDTKLIRQMWDQHQAQSHNWGKELWAVLMFQAWLDSQN